MSEEDTSKGTLTGNGIIAWIIFIVVALIIFIGYMHLLQLNQSQRDKNSIYIQAFMDPIFWQLTHFFFFLALGIFFPRSDFIIIGVAVVWELIEHNLGMIAPKVSHRVNGKYVQYQWWHGDIVDIVIDLFGYYTGKALYFSMNQPDFNFFEVGYK